MLYILIGRITLLYFGNPLQKLEFNFNVEMELRVYHACLQRTDHVLAVQLCMIPKPYGLRGSRSKRPTIYLAGHIKGGAHHSPFAAVSFPDSKRHPFTA